jgi:hypothetical protein
MSMENANDTSNGSYDSEKKRNEYIKTSAVGHNSREALLTNYFSVTTKKKAKLNGG